MSYATDHASALAEIRAAGAVVTFTRSTPGTHDAATDTLAAPTTSTVSGRALQVRPSSAGDRRAYEGAGLIPGEAPMLLVATDTYGSVPLLGDACAWAGQNYVVRAFGDPVAPDGVPVLSRVVVAR